MPLSFAKDAQIVICGAGCFGLSTAYALLQRGYTNILVLERSDVHPAPDAASTDINKIVRSAYTDPVYCALAREAIGLWKDVSTFGDAYRESGVFVLSNDVAALGKDNSIFAIEKASGANVTALSTSEDVSAALPPSSRPGALTGRSGYINPEGGWAAASDGISKLAEVISSRGVKIQLGKEVTGLAYDAFGGVCGVRVRGHKDAVEADIVIAACGAWTAPTFADPDLQLDGRVIATGQPIVTLQLSSEEMERYKDIPVVLDFDTGFYCFPPTSDGVLKAARHYVGVINPGVVSEQDLYEIPLAISSIPEYSRPDVRDRPNATSHSAIPRSEAEFIRRCIREVFPELRDRPFLSGRMCWYNDTTDDDWIIDFHPQYENVLFVAGDSGHGYKFLPNIGRLVVDRLEGSLDSSLAEKFALALDRPGKQVSGSSVAAALKTKLHDTDLIFPEDMDPAATLPTLQQDTAWMKTNRGE